MARSAQITIGLLAITTTILAGAAAAQSIDVYRTDDRLQQLGDYAFPGGNTLALSIGISSGAYRHPLDPPNQFYAISDRGPNFHCGDVEKVAGVAAEALCARAPEGIRGRIYPLPDYTPSIYTVVLNPDGSFTVKDAVAIKDGAGTPTTGSLLPLSAQTNEFPLAGTGEPIPYDPDAMDGEALVKLSDGSFWISEENAPSLAHVAADGRMLARLVPAGVEADLAAADTPVIGAFPALVAKRHLNRGLESIAISPDERFLYTILQSPLDNPDVQAYRTTPNVRLFKIDRASMTVVGEYVYVEDPFDTFRADNGSRQDNVRISELHALDHDRLLVLERISKTTKLYEIDLAGATNILGSAWDDAATSPTLEQVAVADVGIVPVTKRLAFDSADHPQVPAKIEGIAFLGDGRMALINDNDFGITGATTRVLAVSGHGLEVAGFAADPAPALTFENLATHATGVFDDGAAEIVQYDPAAKRLYVTNGAATAIDVLDIADPRNPRPLTAIAVDKLGGGLNSVAVHDGVLAAAIEAETATAPGKVAFFDTAGTQLSVVTVGPMPDMVTFTPNGRFALTANEGEPSDDYTIDPEGSVSIIDLSGGVDKLSDADVTTVTFAAYNDQVPPQGIHRGNPASTLSQNLEPEYIAVTPDSATAYVVLQESNAVAAIDVESGEVLGLIGLGYKDHAVVPLDASDKDGRVALRTWPVLGMYQPDAIVAAEIGGQVYLFSANEGDARDYDGYSEETRVGDLTLDPAAYPDAALLQRDEALGRLKTTTALGDADGDGDVDHIFAYGGRSFSIWSNDGELVWDSGAEIERILARRLPDDFNSTNDENGSFDNRSDDKGPEPEGIVVGVVDGVPYAFVGLERVGGVMVWDVSDPTAPQFVDYIVSRDFTGDAAAGTAGDLAPEGLLFVPAEPSPSGRPLLVVANEVSGTTTIFEIGNGGPTG